MNKTQFYTLSGALLASTALSSVAAAGTIGRFNNVTTGIVTTSIKIANTLFSTTASTANSQVITSGDEFGIDFTNNYTGATHFTAEFTMTGARFVQSSETLANTTLFMVGTDGGTILGDRAASTHCTSATQLAELFVLNDCSSTAGGSIGTTTNIGAAVFTGVQFNNASGLATAGAGITLTGRVYNPQNTSQTFEAAASGTIIQSAVPVTVTTTAAADVIASATTTPTAFVNLSTTNNGNTANGTSMLLFTVNLTSTGARSLNLSTLVTASSLGTAHVTVQSAALSSGSAARIGLMAGAAGAGNVILSAATAANFSSGTATFMITGANLNSQSFSVSVQFGGSAAIPAAAAGSVTTAFDGTTAFPQAIANATGATAAITQGGFRGEINTFNSSANGPFSSYVRIHNNGNVAGTVTVTVKNDDHTSGATLGSSFTTASIMPGTTMQLSASEIEGSTVVTGKLPAGGANIPAANRTGSYTLNITGPIIGYVQHILFDGSLVADVSSYRNNGNTTNAP